MSDLDTTIARLRALPDAEKGAIAAQIELLLDQGADDFLTPAQWADIEARLDRPERFAPHEEVIRAFQDKDG